MTTSATTLTAPKKKRRRLIIGSLCLLLLLIAMTPFILSRLVIANSERYILTPVAATDQDYDCILVLGAGVRPDGNPSPMLEDRLLRAVELYKADAAAYLLVSGDHGQAHYDEVNVMKDYIVGEGVPSAAVFMDHAGFSTYESIYRAQEIFEAQKILIVTQEYHLYRAIYIARKLGLEAYGVNADLRRYPRQSYYNWRETISRSKDFFQVLIKPTPTYMGEPIPLLGSGDVTNDKADN